VLTHSSQNPQHQRFLEQIMAALRERFAPLNRHYEGAWTDSFAHMRCWHQHPTLLDAAKCASAQRIPGWYVFCVGSDSPRELNDAEDEQVRAFRFGTH